MKNKQKIFTFILLFCSILIIGLLTLNLFSSKTINLVTPVGSIFNQKLKNNLVGLLYLDKFHARLLLRKGLPLVRVKDNKLLAKSKNANVVVNLTSKLLIDLPPSFFKANYKVKKTIRSEKKDFVDNSDRLKKKMKAEGRHHGERVELDFWQTESTPVNNNLRERIRKDSQSKKNDIFDNFSSRKKFKTKESKIIGIYHTHTAENYENRGYNAHSKPGERGDITKVGKWLKDKLANKYNIATVHSLRAHDKTYDRSYIRSLETAKSIVNNNRELDMLFDIHRDAIGNGNKDIITTEINGQKVAKIMIVVTNNNYGLPHPNWQKNIAFAKKLATKMNAMYPGLLREVKLISNRRYNQHVHPQALLLEVGGANSTLEEAKRSAYLLADILAELMKDEL